MPRLLGGRLTGVLLGRTEFAILLLGGTFTGVLLVKAKPSDEELKKKDEKHNCRRKQCSIES